MFSEPVVFNSCSAKPLLKCSARELVVAYVEWSMCVAHTVNIVILNLIVNIIDKSRFFATALGKLHRKELPIYNQLHTKYCILLKNNKNTMKCGYLNSRILSKTY